jgi:hypothetical protein
MPRHPKSLGLIIAMAVLSTTCGSITSTTPTTSLLDPSQPRTPPDVSITSAGVQPVVVHVDHPVTITFTNSDTVARRIESAPELGWDDCPEMHGLAPIKPGEKLAVAFSETDAVCAYHDASQPTNVAFQGYVAIH